MSITFEKVLVLKNVPMFSGVSEIALADLISASEEKTYKVGEVLLEVGQESKAMYIILSGLVIFEHNGNVVRDLGPRFVFGEETVFSSMPSREKIIAREKTHLLMIESDRLMQMMALHSSLARRFLRELSLRIQSKNEAF